MKEIITNTWCDAHQARDVSEQVHGMTIPLAIDGDDPQTLDLCADCVAEYLDPLKKLLATFGQPVESTTKPKTRRRAAAAAAPAPSAASASTKPEGSAGKAPAAKKSASSSKSKSKNKGGATAAEIRVWAAENGFQVPDRGRIPQDVREAFDAKATA